MATGAMSVLAWYSFPAARLSTQILEASMPAAMFVALSLVTFGFAQNDDLNLEIGAIIPATHLPKVNRNLLMTHPAQTRPYIIKKVDGIEYWIAYETSTRAIKYLFTCDKHFKTASGSQVGDYIELDNRGVHAFPGWEIRGPEGKDG